MSDHNRETRARNAMARNQLPPDLEKGAKAIAEKMAPLLKALEDY